MSRYQDPIHGAMLTDQWAEGVDFAPLLATRHTQRLRSIRQLGFASVAYPLADHSRFSHAIGTAHVAGQLFLRAKFNNRESSELATNYPGLKKSNSVRSGIRAHLVAAALMQDLGELPYERALASHYYVDQATRHSLTGWGLSSETSKSKVVFALAILREWSSTGLLDELDAHLIAALLDRGIPSPASVTSKLRMILDSEFDADRIDYVHRDSLTTIGHQGNPQELLAAVSSYESDHVRIVDPATLARFLNTRIHLYRSVYMNPEKRVREMALSTVLHEVSTNRHAKDAWSTVPPGEISLEEFLQLNDAVIMQAVNALYDNARGRRALSRNGLVALETLVGQGDAAYYSTWVPPTVEPATRDPVPESLFTDGRDDYARGAVADLDFFRIESGRFLGPDTSSSLRGWIPELDQGTLAPGSLLVFIPKSLDADEMKKLDSAVNSGSLYPVLRERALLAQLGIPSDTRGSAGFTGPAVHISWCWSDLIVVRRIVRVLHSLNVRYFLLLDPFEGVGASPLTNSRLLVKTAECLLVLTSKSYTKRYRDNVNGNIAAELQEVHARLEAGKALPVVVLSANDWTDAQQHFPWGLIGRNEADFVGAIPLESASDEELLAAIQAALTALRARP